MKTNPFPLFAWLLLLLSCEVAFAQDAPERIAWKGDPISIELGVNSERRVTFPDAKVAWADISDALKGKLRTQIVNNDIYWLASADFKPVRITVGEEGSGKIYLFDISASYAKVPATRILVLDGHDPHKEKPVVKNPVQDAPKPEADNLPKQAKRPSHGYASLIRFAALELYAPERLRMKDAKITITGGTRKPVQNLLRHQVADTTPLAAWRFGKLIVTAVQVSNRTSRVLELDPRNLRGAWKAAAFQHGQLQAKGSLQDSTVLYLVSDKPFD